MSQAGLPETSDAGDAATQRPTLVFFYSASSGRCRRVEAYLAHALQRRHNHDTFKVVRVDVEDRTDLARRFRIETVPTLVVIDGRRVVRRIVSPRSGLDLESELAPWLRRSAS